MCQRINAYPIESQEFIDLNKFRPALKHGHFSLTPMDKWIIADIASKCTKESVYERWCKKFNDQQQDQLPHLWLQDNDFLTGARRWKPEDVLGNLHVCDIPVAMLRKEVKTGVIKKYFYSLSFKTLFFFHHRPIHNNLNYLIRINSAPFFSVNPIRIHGKKMTIWFMNFESKTNEFGPCLRYFE